MTSAEQANETFLTTAQLCARWSCSKMFIERHSRADATFPKPLRLGSHRRWPISAVIAWEAAQSVEGSPPESKAKPHAA